MMHILKCVKCETYGLKETCECGGMRARPKPPKYSPEDKYGEYRRQYKEQHGVSPVLPEDEDVDLEDNETEEESEA